MKDFAKIELNKNIEAFIVHVLSFDLKLNISIYLIKKT